MKPKTWELINPRTGNTLAVFDSETDALDALTEDLAVVAFDRKGMALDWEYANRDPKVN